MLMEYDTKATRVPYVILPLIAAYPPMATTKVCMIFGIIPRRGSVSARSVANFLFACAYSRFFSSNFLSSLLSAEKAFTVLTPDIFSSTTLVRAAFFSLISS